MEGWIKLHRKLLKHWIWKNDKYFKAWIYCLFRANHKSNKVLIGSALTELKPGEFITSRFNFAKDNDMTEQSVRTFWKLLESDKMIVKISTSDSTKIIVCNYESYQHEQPANNQQVTNEQPTSNQQVTTDKNVNNEKNDKKCLLKNSITGIDDIKNAFDKTKDLKRANAEYYYNTVLDWSSSNGKMKIDWVATIRNWARNDNNNSKLIIYNNLPPNQMVY